MAGVLADWMDGAGSRGAAGRRRAYPQSPPQPVIARFATVCAADRDQAVAGLRALAAGQPGLGVVLPHDGACGAGTVFVYSGQGSQWAGMGRQLLADEPAFAAAVAELEPVFVAQAGFSLHDVLAGGAAGGRYRTHPAGPGRDAAGADRAVALLRGGARRGDRAFDGRGHRRGGRRGADPRRRACRSSPPGPG